MKLKHLYMLGVVALMTASCNEDRFLDLKPQGLSLIHISEPTRPY